MSEEEGSSRNSSDDEKKKLSSKKPIGASINESSPKSKIEKSEILRAATKQNKGSDDEDESEDAESIPSMDSDYDFESNGEAKILVTGANGFLGAHIVSLLLEKGVTVVATVRDVNEAEVLDDLKADHGNRLIVKQIKIEDFITRWKDVIKGCRGVIHTASPNPYDPRLYQLDLIYPAVEGMINILQASLEEGVKKVVVTSCICAVKGGEYKQNFAEEDWPDPNKMSPIERSKLIAERTAWAFNKDHHAKMAVTSIIPGFLIGPSLSRHCNHPSGRVIKEIAEGRVEKLRKIHLSTCDVRDAAEAHIKALYSKKSNGKRYVCVENSHWMEEIVKELVEKFSPTKGNEDSPVFKPIKIVPKYELTIMNMFDKRLDSIMPFYNKEVYFSNSRIVEHLDVDFRAFSTSIEEMITDLIDKKLLTTLTPGGQPVNKDKDKGSSALAAGKGLIDNVKNLFGMMKK